MESRQSPSQERSHPKYKIKYGLTLFNYLEYNMNLLKSYATSRPLQLFMSISCIDMLPKLLFSRSTSEIYVNIWCNVVRVGWFCCRPPWRAVDSDRGGARRRRTAPGGVPCLRKDVLTQGVPITTLTPAPGPDGLPSMWRDAGHQKVTEGAYEPSAQNGVRWSSHIGDETVISCYTRKH